MTFEAFKLLQPDSRPTVFEARIAADADRDATLARLQGAYIHPPPGPPKTVADFEGIRKLPVLASVLLAAIAAVALAHTLVTAIRRRRRHLAVLKTIGFDRRQVLATVTWQALTFAALGLFARAPARNRRRSVGLVPVRAADRRRSGAGDAGRPHPAARARGGAPRDRRRRGTGVECGRDTRCRGVAGGVTWRSI